MQYLYFTAYEQSQPPKWYQVVRIKGDDSKAFAEAKKVISDILAGTASKRDSLNLWQSFLRGNGEISCELEHLQRQTGVIIHPNKAKAELRLFGPSNRFEEVQAKISEILKGQHLNDFAIELDEETFRCDCMGGYKTLVLYLMFTHLFLSHYRL
ncbi:hypothetical protein F5Y12DRAFT_620338 [Xylaria sp. FL1777]|nr:hypothetical protein F5Y12DRAFT_620338 [Xylaria sp. FL1777]